MSVAENLNQVRKNLPEMVKLVVVSKHQPKQSLIEAYKEGERVFGENRVQELTEKQEALPKDIEWHMIGHLQSNKVKYIAPFVSLIHAVDSLKLLREIDKQAKKNNRKINCLLQFHIAQEESKHGFKTINEVNDLLNSNDFKTLNNIEICGVMGMATNTSNETQIRVEFSNLKSIFNQLKTKYFSENPLFKEISMGMSSDYEIAISQGTTIIRVGSKIFK